MSDRELLEKILRKVSLILDRLQPPNVQLAFGYPQAFRMDGTLANYQLLSDTIAYFPILVLDAAGAAVPAESGDTFSVALTTPTGASAAAVTAAIGVMPGTSEPAVVLTPAVAASPGWSFTVTDADGLAAASEGFDIVADATPKTIEINAVGVVTAPQPTPSAPGP